MRTNVIKDLQDHYNKLLAHAKSLHKENKKLKEDIAYYENQIGDRDLVVETRDKHIEVLKKSSEYWKKIADKRHNKILLLKECLKAVL